MPVSVSTARPLEQRSLPFSSISSSYTLVGSVFEEPVSFLVVWSNCDKVLQFSFDGTKDFFPLISNAPLVLDFKSNLVDLSAVTGIYVKILGDAPTEGTVYVGAIAGTSA